MAVLSVIGVPSSAGSYAAGQDQAPRALRAAGLLQALADAGLDVHDAGDLTEQVWAPDREDRFAQNVGQVATSARELADRVPGLVAGDRRLLVLGGSCTVAVGMVAGVGRDCGLLYVDRHFDMNTPATTVEGALDWMGLAHALDLPGCRDEFAGAFASCERCPSPRWPFLSTSMSSISSTLPSRRTPADATAARRSTSSPRLCGSWWPIRGGVRSRSARSTRPAVPVTRRY